MLPCAILKMRLGRKMGMDFFDLHTDTPSKLLEGILKNKTSGFYSGCFEQYAAVRAFWFKGCETQPLQRCLFLLKAQQKAESSAAFSNRKTLYMVENAGFLAQNFSGLEVLKKWGVQGLSLTWNSENALAGGALSKGVLTPLGEFFLQAAQEKGFFIDLSHLNHESAKAVVQRVRYPVFTHSCCFAVHPHPRNVKDEILQKVAQKGGLIGLCLYPPFLGGNPFEMLPLHLKHLQKLGLERQVAIGSDFDGAEMAENLQKNADIPVLYNHLQCLGFKKELLNALFYENALAFFTRICQNKR